MIEDAEYLPEVESEEDALEAERAFRESFAKTRGSDYEIRPTAQQVERQFVQRVNAQAAKGDAGGAGRTKDAPPIKELSPEREVVYMPVDDLAAEPSAQSDRSTLAVFKALLAGAKNTPREAEPADEIPSAVRSMLSREKLQLKPQWR